jgi:hypothetical protein
MLEANLRKGRRYRYYKPPALSNAEHSAPMTIPAPMLHKVVIDHLRECFKNPQPWLDDLPEEWKARPELAPIHVTESLLVLDSIWHSLQPPLMTTVIQSFVERVVMYPDQMEVVLNVPGLSEFFQGFSVKKLKKQ